jgi:hypothetical protein
MARVFSRRLRPWMTAVVACGVATCAWLLPPVVVPSGSSGAPSFRLIFRSSPEPSGPIYLPNETIPSCAWNPRVTSISLRAARDEGCFPFGAGQSVGIFMSPAGGALNYGQSDLKADVRIARLISGSIVVSPVLMTAEDASGGARPIEAYSGDNCLWVFAYGQYPRPDLYRISTSSGAVLQRSTLNVAYPKMSANPFGAWLGSLDNPGPIYFAPDDRSAPITARVGPVDVDSFQPGGRSIVINVQLASGSPPQLTGQTQAWTFVISET